MRLPPSALRWRHTDSNTTTDARAPSGVRSLEASCARSALAPALRYPVVAAPGLTAYLATRRPTRGMAASTFFLAVGRSFS